MRPANHDRRRDEQTLRRLMRYAEGADSVQIAAEEGVASSSVRGAIGKIRAADIAHCGQGVARFYERGFLVRGEK